MTVRNPVSAPQNIFSNTQNIDDINLKLEQNFNATIQSGIIANQFGYGVLPDDLLPNIIFDSTIAMSDGYNGYLDGIAILAQNQPTDKNFGNQLAISLSNSQVGGNKTIKVCIVGLDFQSNIQYETFVFRANELQVSYRHFTNVLAILFNDFIGNPNLSFNLGGNIVIQEASPMTLSRDPIMVSQEVQPNLFFRDFFFNDPTITSVTQLLQNALPLYNVSSLNIQTSELGQQILYANDVTSQIGEKFVAVNNNIQKVTLLLSVQNTAFGQGSNLLWTGDLVCSIYPLQSSVECPTDIAPSSPIYFSPSNVPLAQISLEYQDMLNMGIVLDGTPQPIDFVFSNSVVASGTSIIPGAYYAVTLKRGGTNNQCDILLATGATVTDNSMITVFTGNIWTDIPDQQLWFQVWNDSAKVSDGQCYENGHGVIIPKTNTDPTTEATVDYCLDDIDFTGNQVFSAVLSAITVDSDPIPDQRTGQPVDSVQQFEPQVSLLDTIDITNLEAASEPFILGVIQDKNIKVINTGNTTITANLYSATMVGDELLIRVENYNDGYDTSVVSLQSSLLNGLFDGAMFYPNSNNPHEFYRVADVSLCTYILGDVNGDGIIDNTDLLLLNSYVGYNLNVGLPLNTVASIAGTNPPVVSVTNGYTTYTDPFATQSGVTYSVIDGYGNSIMLFNAGGNDGYSSSDGYLTADPADPRLATFYSASMLFNDILGLTQYRVFINSPTMPQNYGAFSIVSVDSATNIITLQKIYLTGDVVGQLLRADVDGDFDITYNDGYLLNSYVERLSNNSYGIGSTFNVIRVRLENFVDRTDDYSYSPSNRAISLHTAPDIFVNDGYFASHNFNSHPSPMSFVQQLTWDESLVVSNGNPKQVPCSFTSLNGDNENTCNSRGITCDVYGDPPVFDKGRVDLYAPDNLILGDGDIVRPNGQFYKVDFEVGTVVLEIPPGLDGYERNIDVLHDFIATTVVNGVPTGITSKGFPAMRFSNCSFVSANAFANNQVRLSVSVQSFSPNTFGSSPGGYGDIVDGKMGVYIDYSTGLLTLNFTNLYQDIVMRTLNTKIQINVFLKQGGFNNNSLFIDSAKVANMLNLSAT